MEKRYESDLTPKEKRQLEWKKVKGLSGGKKIEYLWTYYKYWLLVLAAVVFVIYFAVSVYQNARRNPILSVAIVDANWQNETGFEQLSSGLLEAMGTGDKYEEVALDTSVASMESPENMMKATVTIAGGELDLVVCGREFYDHYSEQGAFADWKDILGDEYDAYEPYMTDNLPDLSKSSKWTDGEYTLYQPVYLCCMNTAPHPEQAKAFLDYFF